MQIRIVNRGNGKDVSNPDGKMGEAGNTTDNSESNIPVSVFQKQRIAHLQKSADSLCIVSVVMDTKQ